MNIIEKVRPQAEFVDRLLSKLFVLFLTVMILLAIAVDVLPQTAGRDLNKQDQPTQHCADNRGSTEWAWEPMLAQEITRTVLNETLIEGEN